MSGVTLLSLLGIQLPIIQAPMAGISTPALAAAVSNAGGLGFLGLGAATASGARAQIRETRALTEKPFGVNVFCHKPAILDEERIARWLEWLAPQFAQFGKAPPASLREIYMSFQVDRAMQDLLLGERPAVVSFHFGVPPPDTIRLLKRAGIVLMATATSLEEAHAIARTDIDVIVAQGGEAGGHRGIFDPEGLDEELATLALTRLLVKHTTKPIIAAGGIMDGAGIAAMLALGAQAAQLGTAFVTCSESAADDEYRRALASTESRRTVFTVTISGRKARGLVNRFTALDDLQARPAVPDYPLAYDAGKALRAAAKASGVEGYGAHWAGQGAWMTRPMPAAALVELLSAELQAAIAAVAATRNTRTSS
jgi:nitronate monooxygenase